MDKAWDVAEGPFLYSSTEFAALPRHRQLLRELAPAFAAWSSREALQNMNEGHARGAPSLRLYDWLCVNFAKKQALVLGAVNGGSERFVQLHVEYKTWLATWKRKLFDPFKRGPRVHYADGNGGWASTTVGQLNFFTFLRGCGVFEYLDNRQNRALVEQHMADTLRAARDRKRAAQTQKRQSLTEAPRQQCVVVNLPASVCFEPFSPDHG